MKLAELIRTNQWLSVELTLLNLYPDQHENIDAYKEIFEILQELEIVESEIQIKIEQEYDDITCEESMANVFGTKKNKNGNQITDGLAIEFVPWKEWLGMTISQKTSDNFNELEIISHCLYEMTFMGYTEEEIQNELIAIEKTTEEYKNMTEEEKKANTKSLEDLFNEVENE